jgi:ABC-2 type transport system ATP-binding protein
MIEIAQVTKRYGGFAAIEDITLTAGDGMVYGLVGYNGAGKTTLLKTVAGVYLPDEGRVLVDGEEACSGRVPERTPFIVADEPFFIPQATPDSMRAFYAGYYPYWSDATYANLMQLFGLERKARISGFSKGMQRQTAILLGLSTGAKSLLLDESFDGLDLSKRILLKRLLRKYAQVRNAAVILSSHNLLELEDVADRIGMIEGHRLAFDETVEDLHAKNPGRSLEQIFLDEREVSDLDLERVFIW